MGLSTSISGNSGPDCSRWISSCMRKLYHPPTKRYDIGVPEIGSLDDALRLSRRHCSTRARNGFGILGNASTGGAAWLPGPSPQVQHVKAYDQSQMTEPTFFQHAYPNLAQGSPILVDSFVSTHLRFVVPQRKGRMRPGVVFRRTVETTCCAACSVMHWAWFGPRQMKVSFLGISWQNIKQ